MTTLIVRPIKLDQPGSYRERRRFISLLRRLRDAKSDPDAALDVMEEADQLLIGRLETDDGTPVEDALDRLSANEFDQLLSAVAFEGGVGEQSRLSSTDGPGDSLGRTSQTG